MKLNSKADTILNLKKYNLNFSIPETFVFKTDEWQFSEDKIIKVIQKKFKSKIVIRSSSYDEDLKNFCLNKDKMKFKDLILEAGKTHLTYGFSNYKSYTDLSSSSKNIRNKLYTN